MNRLKWMLMYAGGRFRRQFFMSLPENEVDYEKSRVQYIIGDTANQTIAQLAGGTFLMTLLTYVGMLDGTIGIVISLGTLATFCQLLSMYIVKRIKKYKLFVCVCASMRIWFGVLYFVPLLFVKDPVKQVLIIILFLITQIGSQLANPAAVDWIASLVPIDKRGSYFAKKDAVAVFVTVFSMFLMGILLDVTKKDHILLGLMIVGGVLILLGLINGIAFMKMKEPRSSYINQEGKELHGSLAKKEKQKLAEANRSMKEEIVDTLKHKGFQRMLLLNGIWTVSFYSSSPFNTSYAVKELSLSYTYIMTISLATTVVRVLLMPIMGRKGDKNGNEKILMICFVSMTLFYMLMMFTVPGNAMVCYPIAQLFSAIGWCYIGIGLLNLQLQFLDDANRTIQYTILSALSGIAGFVTSFIVGKLVNWLQTKDLVLFGMKIYAQQITNLFGVVSMILLMLYLYMGYIRKMES